MGTAPGAARPRSPLALEIRLIGRRRAVAPLSFGAMESWTTPELVPLATAADAENGFIDINFEEFQNFPGLNQIFRS